METDLLNVVISHQGSAACNCGCFSSSSSPSHLSSAHCPPWAQGFLSRISDLLLCRWTRGQAFGAGGGSFSVLFFLIGFLVQSWVTQGCPVDFPRLLHPDFWSRGGMGDTERRFNSKRSPSKSGDCACQARPLWSQLHRPPKEQG